MNSNELREQIDDYIDDIRYNNEIPFDERLDSAKKSLKHLCERIALEARIDELRWGAVLAKNVEAHNRFMKRIVELKSQLKKLEVGDK